MNSACSPRSREGFSERISPTEEPFVLKREIRCQNGRIHCKHKGNILAAVGYDSIYVLCRDRGCKRWTRLQIRIPGIKFDLRESAIVQETMPEGYHLDLTEATTIVSERKK